MGWTMDVRREFSLTVGAGEMPLGPKGTVSSVVAPEGAPGAELLQQRCRGTPAGRDAGR